MQPVRHRRPGSVHISAPSFPVGVRPSVYRRIAYTFIGLTVVVILGVLWLTSVRADVVVRLKRDAVRLDGVVEVAKEPRAGQIPGRVVQGTFTKTREYTVAGESGQPSDPTKAPAPEPTPSDDVRARGTVRIVNNYSREQPLVRTTRLLTPDGKLYRIDETIRVPAGGSVTVAAYADQPGRAFVLTAPTKFTIPGLFIDLQTYIYAETVGPFEAVPLGTPATASVTPTPSPTRPVSPNARPVSYEDLDRAKKTLTDEILNEAMRTLANQVEARESMEVVYVVKVLDESKNANIGQVTDSFLYSIKLDVTAVYYSKDDMQALVRSRLRERVPEGREFLPFTGGAVTYALESADPVSEIAVIRVTADANYRLSPTSPLLQKSVIAGKSVEEARRLLQSIDGVESTQITVKPSWLGSLPALKDRIELTVE